MTSRDFAYWLQGYFEILDPSLEAAPFPLGPAQVKSIRDHLQLVFTHDINPPKPDPAERAKIDLAKLQQQFVTGVWDQPNVSIC